MGPSVSSTSPPVGSSLSSMSPQGWSCGDTREWRAGPLQRLRGYQSGEQVSALCPAAHSYFSPAHTTHLPICGKIFQLPVLSRVLQPLFSFGGGSIEIEIRTPFRKIVLLKVPLLKVGPSILPAKIEEKGKKWTIQKKIH